MRGSVEVLSKMILLGKSDSVLVFFENSWTDPFFSGYKILGTGRKSADSIDVETPVGIKFF